MYGNLVGGAFVVVEETFADTNPAAPDDVVGRFPASGRPRRSTRPSRPPRRAAGLAAHAARGARAPPVALARDAARAEDEIVAAITREQGKPLAESRGEFGKTLEYLEYYARAWPTSTAAACCRRRGRAWSSRCAASRSAWWRC